MNEKGVQLAVNQIVILIIALVILSLGLTFTFKVFGQAETSLPSLDQQLATQIEHSLHKSDQVVAMPSTVKKGRAKDLLPFHLGVRHDPALTSGNTFKVLISFTKGIGPGSTNICSGDCAEGMLADALLIPGFSVDAEAHSAVITVADNDIDITPLGVVAKANPDYAGKGQYFYAACVCAGNDCVDKATSFPISSCDPATVSSIGNLYGFVTFSAVVQ